MNFGRRAPGAAGESGARSCMGTLVLDDLVDDPRVGSARADTPGDMGRTRDEAGQSPPPVADPRAGRHGDPEDQRRGRRREVG